MNRHQEIATLLLDLEATMRNMGLWSHRRPSKRALASAEPFCIDTLSFDQWLQFVFIERLQLLVETAQPLPTQSGVVPMAEEYFRDQVSYPNSLLKILADIDDVISR